MVKHQKHEGKSQDIYYDFQHVHSLNYILIINILFIVITYVIHRNTHRGNVILIFGQKYMYAYLFVWTRGVYFQKFNLGQKLDEYKDKTKVIF